ncbi:MAG TPA: M55 family metallopeptidase [Clostridia bacterium]|nr:M55 family metallopeptidase [Clostridia bacterium]
MKLFLSADLEGVAGVCHWDQTTMGNVEYAPAAHLMSLEVAAACEGALAGGAAEILVKDAHDGGRNIDPLLLPESVRLLRGSTGHVFIMMSGLDESFDGVFFTGYHSPAGMDTNPLSHTMNTRNVTMFLNGEPCSELYLNALTASYCKVPVLLVAGDRGLCDWMNRMNPNTLTVPVSEGLGNASIGLNPALAQRLIREAAEKAVQLDRDACRMPMPKSFDLIVTYRQHYQALRASFYPSVTRESALTVRFQATDYLDILRFILFVL